MIRPSRGVTSKLGGRDLVAGVARYHLTGSVWFDVGHVGNLPAGTDDHRVDGDVELVLTLLAALAHASPAKPVISVNVV